MEKHVLAPNEFLKVETEAYYSCDYIGYGKEGNPNYLNVLKNQFRTESYGSLNEAQYEVIGKFFEAFDELKNKFEGEYIWVVAVPRSKANFETNQQLFVRGISKAINHTKQRGYMDITSNIKRKVDTKTTHLKNYENNPGDMPYPGITEATCSISKGNISGRNILLIDDIYTEGVNIDEDCIQALYNAGAKKVILYTVAKTVKKY